VELAFLNRILLVFATDGVTIAADIVDNMADYAFDENPLIKVSFQYTVRVQDRF
jgi:hypothetical protein